MHCLEVAADIYVKKVAFLFLRLLIFLKKNFFKFFLRNTISLNIWICIRLDSLWASCGFKEEKILQNLSSAALVIGTIKVVNDYNIS